MLIQCGCQNVISIVTLFGVRITAQDKHFQDVNRRAALQWGGQQRHISTQRCKNVPNKSITARSALSPASRFQRWGFYELGRGASAPQPFQMLPVPDSLRELRYAPQQYTGVCLQCRRPCHKATFCTGGSPLGPAPSTLDFPFFSLCPFEIENQSYVVDLS